MPQYDEYGRPIPPSMWPMNDPVAMQSMQSPPPAPEVAPMEPAPVQPQPSPQQRYLSEAYGIGTSGPMADQAAETAQTYNAAQQATVPGSGQYMPQQFGQEETGDRSAEGVLTPQETAEKMPTNKFDMEKLIKQHLLPRHPAASKDGYANSITAKDEASKADRQQRALMNRAATREKTQDAWDQTMRVNALQGAGPLAQGGQSSFGGGGRVSKVGGYTFVGGSWRKQGADEQAKTDLANAQTDLIRARPGMEAAELRSREGIAKAGLEVRGREYDAERRNEADRLAETKRTHIAKEEDDEQEELEDDRFEVENILAEIKRREGNAASRTPNGPNKGEFTRSLDTDFSKLEPDPLDPAKKSPKYSQGSYDIMRNRLKHLAKKLQQASKAGKYKAELPPEILLMLDDSIK